MPAPPVLTTRLMPQPLSQQLTAHRPWEQAQSCSPAAPFCLMPLKADAVWSRHSM